MLNMCYLKANIIINITYRKLNKVTSVIITVYIIIYYSITDNREYFTNLFIKNALLGY